MNNTLENALAEANGRRQVRTLSIDEIVDAAKDLRPGEHTFLHGGHVANSYKYPAVATIAVVYRRKGERLSRAIISVGSATKGSTGFGRRDQWTPPAKSANEVVVRFTKTEASQLETAQ